LDDFLGKIPVLRGDRALEQHHQANAGVADRVLLGEITDANS
tara:strand:+ start:251 stop:376 length:126 start_codon:yes stop_codon:yes gene_type:complete